MGAIAQRPPHRGPKLPPAQERDLGLRPPPGPARSCPALAGLTLSARWWTRPRPGWTSSCSSPSSGNSRRPVASGGQREPEGPTSAGTAMFVPASPAASSPAHFRGQRAAAPGRAWKRRWAAGSAVPPGRFLGRAAGDVAEGPKVATLGPFSLAPLCRLSV